MQAYLSQLLKKALENSKIPVTDPRNAALYAAVAVTQGYKVVFITQSASQAADLQDWTRFFLRGSPVSPHAVVLTRPPIGPYEQVLPDPGAIGARNAALYGLLDDGPMLLSVDVATALRKVPDPELFMDHVVTIHKGQTLLRTALEHALTSASYMRVGMVQSPGEYAVRGGIVDCFSPLAPYPVRVEFFGDEIESIRFFDPADQGSVVHIRDAVMVPAGTLLQDPDISREALRRMDTRRPQKHSILPQWQAIMDAIEKGLDFPGAMGFEALLLGGLAPMSAYFDDRTLVFLVKGSEVLSATAEGVLSEAAADFEEVNSAGVIPDPVDALFCNWQAFLSPVAKAVDVVAGVDTWTSTADKAVSARLSMLKDEELGLSERFRVVNELLRDLAGQGRRVLLVALDERESNRVQDLVSSDTPVQALKHPMAVLDWIAGGADPGVYLATGKAQGVVTLDDAALVIISTSMLFGRTLQGYKHKSASHGPKLLDIPFRENDLVVHRNYGIGLFEGLVQSRIGGEVGEFLRIRYRDDAILYVPVYAFDAVTRYRAPRDLELVRLDKLGSDAWVRRRQKAGDAAAELAARLGELYALRSTIRGHAFRIAGDEFKRFEEAFPYEETPDQARVVDEVLADLAASRPMDRLVVGDVGYGKTEVAMRAAYAVVLGGKQVAVLVPTTILATQHRRMFSRRFRGTGVVVESLSRLDGTARRKQVLEGLRTGYVDIIIGTHRLLSQDVVFRDLGLLVIDEEHRFGVRHKERIREIARFVDTLTLTATPIPRTLHMAFAGVRELSIMATPPKERVAVQNFVARRSGRLVRRAINRELERGGQVYYVHNRINDQDEVEAFIKDLVPAARVVAVHGRMPKEAIEKVMARFVAREIDVLITTTIIESGLDIPNANTMVIERADTFGLAQLYQLRGRIGRSSRQAYCYFLLPGRGKISRSAVQRLNAIQKMSGLSSGFNLASADLEIRGAGNMFGAQQSGHIGRVGYDLYMEMVQEAIRRLRSDIQDTHTCELDIDTPMVIPEEQVPDSDVRLSVYQAVSRATNLMEVEELRASFIDRFGFPVPLTNRLFLAARLRVNGTRLQVQKVIKKGRSVKVHADIQVLGLIASRATDMGLAADIQNQEPPFLSITFPTNNAQVLNKLDDLLTLCLDDST